MTVSRFARRAYTFDESAVERDEAGRFTFKDGGGGGTESGGKTFEFMVDYAADKDSMSEVSGTANVRVLANNPLEARLVAEQMVAARGVEPVAVETVTVEEPDPVSKMMAALADPDSGMTISRDGDVPTTGYVVAVEGHSRTIPADEFTADREKATDFVDQYLADNAEALDGEGAMLGLWNDPASGNIFFDVVEHVADREEAVRLGAERDQIAIFDLEALDVVPTGGTGGLPQDGDEQATQAAVADDGRGTARLRGDPRRQDGLSRYARRAYAFDESAVERDEGGRFTSKGEGAQPGYGEEGYDPNFVDPYTQIGGSVDRMREALPGVEIEIDPAILDRAEMQDDPRIRYDTTQDYADAVSGVATGFERMAAEYPEIVSRIGTIELGPTDSKQGGLGQYQHRGSDRTYGDNAPPLSFKGDHMPLIQIDINGIVKSHAEAYNREREISTHTVPSQLAGRSMERLTEGVATHEFGHAAYYAAPSPVQMHASAEVAFNRGQYDTHLSDYAGTNQHEYFAEAFTANALGMSDRLTDADRNMLRAAGVDVAARAAAPEELPSSFKEDPPPDTFEGSIIWEYARERDAEQAAIAGPAEIIREIPDKFAGIEEDEEDERVRRAYVFDESAVTRDSSGRFARQEDAGEEAPETPHERAMARTRAERERESDVLSEEFEAAHGTAGERRDAMNAMSRLVQSTPQYVTLPDGSRGTINSFTPTGGQTAEVTVLGDLGERMTFDMEIPPEEFREGGRLNASDMRQAFEGGLAREREPEAGPAVEERGQTEGWDAVHTMLREDNRWFEPMEITGHEGGTFRAVGTTTQDDGTRGLVVAVEQDGHRLDDVFVPLADRHLNARGEIDRATLAIDMMDGARVRIDPSFVDGGSRWDDEYVRPESEYRERFERIDSDLEAALPPGVTGDLRYGDESATYSIEHENGGNGVVSFDFPRGDVLHVDLMQFSSDMQGEGVATAVVGGLIQSAEEMGIREVQFQANISVGGYAWARMGAYPTEQSWESLQADIEARLLMANENGIHIDPAAKTELDRLLDGPPTGLPDLAALDTKITLDEETRRSFPSNIRTDENNQIELGKALLLGTTWSAALPIGDQAAREDFSQYEREKEAAEATREALAAAAAAPPRGIGTFVNPDGTLDDETFWAEVLDDATLAPRQASISRFARRAYTFDESNVERDAGGRFTFKGGGGGESSAPPSTEPDAAPIGVKLYDGRQIQTLDTDGLPLPLQPEDPFSYENGGPIDTLGKSDREEDLDEVGRMFDANRQVERAWEEGIADALATGKISYEDAVERWGEKYGSPLIDSIAKDLGGQRWEPLPEEMWHVTTDAPAVETSGMLMTRKELDMDRAVGLGGGSRDTISFTTSREMAERIYDAMGEAQKAASGEWRVIDMMNMAHSGERAERPFASNIAHYYAQYDSRYHHEDWTPGDPYPRPLQELIDNEDNRVATPDERLDFYKTFSLMRQSQGGPEDPLFFGTDAEALAAKDPADFGIVKVRPVDGAMGVQMSSMGEWRIPTGAAVEIEKIANTASLVWHAPSRFARRAYTFDESEHPRDTSGRFSMKDETSSESEKFVGKATQAGAQLATIAQGRDWGPARRDGDSEWDRWGFTPTDARVALDDAKYEAHKTLEALGYDPEAIDLAVNIWSGGATDIMREQIDAPEPARSSPMVTYWEGANEIYEIASATEIGADVHRAVLMSDEQVAQLAPGVAFNGSTLESWSRDPEVAKDFGIPNKGIKPLDGNEGTTQVLMRLSNGRGVDIAPLGMDSYAWQDEVLVAGDAYRIDSVRAVPASGEMAGQGEAPYPRVYLDVTAIPHPADQAAVTDGDALGRALTGPSFGEMSIALGHPPDERPAGYGDDVVGQTLVRPEPREAAAKEPRARSAQQIMSEQIRSARRLRDRFAIAKRDVVRQLAAGAEIAFAEALRHAGVRAISRARNKQSRAAAVTVAAAFDSRQSLQPFFAALGVNETTLLAGSFSEYERQVKQWLEAHRHAQQRIALEEGWDDEVDDLVSGDDDSDTLAATFLAASLFALAASRILSGDDPTVEAKGEVSGVVPNGLMTRSLDVASGRAYATLGESALEAPTLVPLQRADVEELIATGLRDRLRSSLSAELRARRQSGRDATTIVNALDGLDADEPMTEYVWVHGFYGDPKTVFEPHLRLDGHRTTNPEGDDEFLNIEAWPEGGRYFPGDHSGCTCELVAQVPGAVDRFVDAVA